LETAARATTEEEPEPAAQVVEKASKGNRWIALLFAAVVVIGLAFAGLAAWNWYQSKNTPPPAPVVVARPHPRKPAVAPVLSGAAAPPPPQTATTTTAAPMVIKPPASTPTPVPAPPPATAMKITPNTT